MKTLLPLFFLVLIWPSALSAKAVPNNKPVAADAAPSKVAEAPSADSRPEVETDSEKASQEPAEWQQPEAEETPNEVELELEPPNSPEAPSDDDQEDSSEDQQQEPESEDEQPLPPVQPERVQSVAVEQPKTPKVAVAMEEQEAALVQKKAERMARQGEAEFIGFVDPDYIPGKRMADKQEVQVKRAQTLHFDNDGERALAMGNFVFLAVVTVCSALAIVGLTVAGVVYYRLHKQHLAAQEAEYPQYGVIGPGGKERRNKATARGDQRMAYSAQLHHYQQTKQKIISMEQSGMEQRDHESDGSEDEGEEGDYSVYECPGLAPTGDIEVSNPMFEKNGATTPSEPSKKPPAE